MAYLGKRVRWISTAAPALNDSYWAHNETDHLLTDHPRQLRHKSIMFKYVGFPHNNMSEKDVINVVIAGGIMVVGFLIISRLPPV